MPRYTGHHVECDRRSKGLFSAAKMARLKNTSSLLNANSLIDVCAFRASMQQFSETDVSSTVAF